MRHLYLVWTMMQQYSMESIVDSKDKLHFFEYLQIDLMQEYLRTGIHYFVNAIINAHPKLVPLRYWSSEITAFLDFLKDFISLTTQHATYAQNFFGYKRPELGRWGALRGALIWTILPYLGSKIDRLYNDVVGEEMDGARLPFLKKLIKQVYPYLYCCLGLIQTIYKFRYLYLQGRGSDGYYQVLYKVEKMHLERSEGTEGQRYPILQLLKKPGLLLLLVGHKVLTWYFSQKTENKMRAQPTNEVVSAPIQAGAVRESGKCGICTKVMRNPTMVRATGYVYCWECISSYIRKEKRCPLGGVDVNPESLQILYG